MMQYLVELDIIPLCVNGLRYPITRRHLVVGNNISEALQAADKENAPGQDCVAIRITEIGEKE